MKIAALISRILLGLVFVFFGSNGFMHFLPATLPPGPAAQFLGALAQSHYILLISGVQVAGGVLLLVNRFVPLALTLLGPEIVNILAFHTFLFRQGLVGALVVAGLWFVLFFRYRQYFAGLFVQRAS